ncbi:hypothetical protein AAIR98_001236 [Elusimicrobium simillimum]|uniref:hypothetical protein n=1 Tax=Elusimicrobium simillimum TaxID=3143438 RepID=UPI003C6F697E
MNNLYKIISAVLSVVLLSNTFVYAQKPAGKGFGKYNVQGEPVHMTAYAERYKEDKMRMPDIDIGGEDVAFLLAVLAMLAINRVTEDIIVENVNERTLLRKKLKNTFHYESTRPTYVRNYNQTLYDYGVKVNNIIRQWGLESLRMNPNSRVSYDPVRAGYYQSFTINNLSELKKLAIGNELKRNMELVEHAIRQNPALAKELNPLRDALVNLQKRPPKNMIFKQEAIYSKMESHGVAPARIWEEVVLAHSNILERNVVQAHLLNIRKAALTGNYAKFTATFNKEAFKINRMTPGAVRFLKGSLLFGAFMLFTDSLAANGAQNEKIAKIFENIDLLTEADQETLNAIEANPDLAAPLKEALNTFHALSMADQETQEEFADKYNAKAKKIKFSTPNNAKHTSYGVKTGR